jgi:hypothetical protein
MLGQKIKQEGSDQKMNTAALKAAMILKEINTEGLSAVLQMSRVSLGKRLYEGKSFTAEEIRVIATTLDLDLQKVNAIFFDGSLRDRNYNSAIAHKFYVNVRRETMEHDQRK